MSEPEAPAKSAAKKARKPKRASPRRKPTTRARARSSEAEPESASRSKLVFVSRRDERIAKIEEWLASGLSARQAARRSRIEFGLKSRSQSYAYVALVLKRWQQDSEDEPRESRRNRLRATIENGIRLALERVKYVRFGRDETKAVADPDVRALARLVQTLGMLDGLIDRSAQQQEEARELAANEVAGFIEAVRSALDSETWERVDRALGEARVAGGEVEVSPD